MENESEVAKYTDDKLIVEAHKIQAIWKYFIQQIEEKHKSIDKEKTKKP